MFEKKTPCVIAAFERHEHEPESPADSDLIPTFEFLKCRGRFMTDDNYERKLYAELAYAIDDAAYDDHDGIIVVAYPEDGSDVLHALVAYEFLPGRGVTVWHDEEIADQIQTIEA